MMIPIVRITRLEENHISGTFGVMRINAETFCWTLEPKDVENATGISSIPAQQYLCEWDRSPKYGMVYHVRGVPERSNVLIHWGNWVANTRGCILLGSSKGLIGRRVGVGNSKKTVKKFHDVMNKKPFILSIEESY